MYRFLANMKSILCWITKKMEIIRRSGAYSVQIIHTSTVNVIPQNTR